MISPWRLGTAVSLPGSRRPGLTDERSNEEFNILERSVRWLYFAAGWLCLALGAVGAVLPVLPTTPFVLLAAWCFSKSSTRLHSWLLSHRTFGPYIVAWEQHRVIPLRAKILSASIIALLIGYMLIASPAPVWAKVLAVAFVVWGQAYVWTKPSHPITEQPARSCDDLAVETSAPPGPRPSHDSRT